MTRTQTTPDERVRLVILPDTPSTARLGQHGPKPGRARQARQARTGVGWQMAERNEWVADSGRAAEDVPVSQ